MSEEEHAEQHRLRRTTRHLILSIAAVAVFGLALLAVTVLVPRPEPVPPSPSPSPSPSPGPLDPQQQTVLIQASTSAGAFGNVLTAHSEAADPNGVLLAIPSDLVVSSPGVPAQPLSDTIDSIDTLRPAAAVAATLGVRVDASWRLDRKALAGLVDSVSGITVTVPERVRVRDEDGQVVLALRPGRQRLSGTSASWYAVGPVPDQTDLQASARFEEVLLRTLARLPDSDLDIREALTALGALAPSTIATQDLAVYLHDLSEAVRVGAVTRATVPSTQLRLGTDRDDNGVITNVDYRWTDYAQAAPLVRDVLPAALWEAGVQGPARALVMQPATEPGWLGYADAALSGAGFVFVDGRGTPHRSVRRSSVTVRGPAEWGRDVAATLGIPADRVAVEAAATTGHPPKGAPWADVDVTLGRRWVPGAGDD